MSCLMFIIKVMLHAIFFLMLFISVLFISYSSKKNASEIECSKRRIPMWNKSEEKPFEKPKQL